MTGSFSVNEKIANRAINALWGAVVALGLFGLEAVINATAKLLQAVY